MATEPAHEAVTTAVGALMGAAVETAEKDPLEDLKVGDEVHEAKNPDAVKQVEPATVKVPFGAAAQPSPFSAQVIDLAAQRGEYERVQVVVAADRPLHNLSIAVSPLAAPGLSVRSFQQGYIWLGKNFTAALPAIRARTETTQSAIEAYSPTMLSVPGGSLLCQPTPASDGLLSTCCSRTVASDPALASPANANEPD